MGMEPNTPDQIQASVPSVLARRSQEDTLGGFLEGAWDCAIYMIDADGYVASWNAGANAQRLQPEEIIGRHFSEFYTPEDRQAGLPARALAIAAKTGKFEGEGWGIKKTGTRFWASVLIDAMTSGEDSRIRKDHKGHDRSASDARAAASESKDGSHRATHGGIGTRFQ